MFCQETLTRKPLLSLETLTISLLSAIIPKRNGIIVSRKAIATTLILSLLVSVLAGTLLIKNEAKSIVQGETSNSGTIVNGNPEANIIIQSPENLTYNKNNISLAFTIETSIPQAAHGSGFGPIFVYGVALDHDTSNVVNQVVSNVWGINKFPDNVLTSLTSLGNNLYAGNATLNDLSQGHHNVTVWEAAYFDMLSYTYYTGAIFSTVSFNIDSIPPHITILSPETKVYHTSDVPMDFTVNKTFSQITYSLDGHENITAVGNTTLARLSNGAHNVTVYATDLAGNIGASQTVTFTISTFPTTTVIVVSGTVAAVIIAVGLLVYFRRYKPKVN